ncbi:MAG: hypothetical protein DI529_17285, partial [Chryseobacterium sp.]
EGFEPPDLLQSTVFKTAAIDHSANSPYLPRSLVFSGANIESFYILRKLFLTKKFNYLIIKRKN